MGPAYYVMAILGCGEADTACEPVTTVAARYESAAQCEAATNDALQRHSDALFPVVVAQCRQEGTQISQKVWADEVKLPSPGQQPQIRRAAYAARGSRS